MHLSHAAFLRFLSAHSLYTPTRTYDGGNSSRSVARCRFSGTWAGGGGGASPPGSCTSLISRSRLRLRECASGTWRDDVSKHSPPRDYCTQIYSESIQFQASQNSIENLSVHVRIPPCHKWKHGHPTTLAPHVHVRFHRTLRAAVISEQACCQGSSLCTLAH